ncbi:hypothetical protein JL720_1587 [Aureococcus anophagefferens]|nr:hypothetical protein JL720_1587 [Aureococcus anophagefferens]
MVRGARAAALCVAAAAAARWCAFVLAPLPVGEPARPLDDGAYDLVDVAAPVAAGWRLRVLAGLFRVDALYPALARFLLNANGVDRVRSLARAVPERVPSRPLPLVRLGAAEYERQVAAAAAWSPDVAPRRRRRWSVEDYARAYRSGATTPAAVAEALLAAVPRLEAALGRVFAHCDAAAVRAGSGGDAALRGRRAAVGFRRRPRGRQGHDRRRGLPQVLGRSLPAGPGRAATRRRAARDAGAIVVGATVMTEFGISPIGWNAHYGGARNPWDADRCAGGSSTGSAVAVAAGLLPVAVGFDGGGSVRVPAALTGLYGLAAGFARVPFRTEAPCSMTHAGPFATTARDAELALVYALISAPAADGEGTHTTTTLYRPPPPSGAEPPRRMRLGVLRGAIDDSEPDVRDAVEAALAALAEDHELVDVAIPHLMTLCARRRRPPFRPRGTDAPRRSLAHSMTLSSEMAFMHDAEFAADGDPPLEDSTRVALAMGRNLLGLPSLSVPVESPGLPVGLLLTAPWWRESALLGLAKSMPEVDAPRPRVFASEFDALLAP